MQSSRIALRAGRFLPCGLRGVTPGKPGVICRFEGLERGGGFEWGGALGVGARTFRLKAALRAWGDGG